MALFLKTMFPSLSGGECCGFRLQHDLINDFQTTA